MRWYMPQSTAKNTHALGGGTTLNGAPICRSAQLREFSAMPLIPERSSKRLRQRTFRRHCLAGNLLQEAISRAPRSWGMPSLGEFKFWTTSTRISLSEPPPSSAGFLPRRCRIDKPQPYLNDLGRQRIDSASDRVWRR